ncbi:MAG: carboxylesterase family protein [Myxococcota bacterium]|nr:carboxylesterase family protein [Myxococcota bacterium]
MLSLLLACFTDKGLDIAESAEAVCDGQEPLLNSSTGCIQGVQHQGLSMFLGIPYAQPPVGDLRWKRTQPVLPWNDTIIADSLSDACTQPDSSTGFYGAEDCLTLNIFRPEVLPDDPLPILFFTHGGSYIAGMGSFNVYNLPPMIAEQSIFITHNYRLGVFGFLAHDELTREDAAENGGSGTSGNVGLYDTLTALQWVHDNAEALGGDPSQIMIFGESAGAYTTCMLLLHPESEGLFSSAIVQSSGCTFISSTLQQAEQQGREYESDLGCDSLACMRAATTEEIMNIDSGPVLGPGSGFAPNFDGVFLPQAPFTMFHYGDLHKVPVAMGINGNEGSLFIRYLGLTEEEELEETIRYYGNYFGISDLDSLVAMYTSSEYGGVQDAMDQFYGDLFFTCSARLALDLIDHFTPTYAYYYTHEPSWLSANGLNGWGAYHGSELPFVFGTGMNYLPISEQSFAEQMQNTWINFAQNVYDTEGAGRWEKYNSGSGDRWLSLHTDGFDMISNVRQEQCDFFFEQWFGQ